MKHISVILITWNIWFQPKFTYHSKKSKSEMLSSFKERLWSQTARQVFSPSVMHFFFAFRLSLVGRSFRGWWVWHLCLGRTLGRVWTLSFCLLLCLWEWVGWEFGWVVFGKKWLILWPCFEWSGIDVFSYIPEKKGWNVKVLLSSDF